MLGERPCRVIVVSDRSVHQGARRRPGARLESPRCPLQSGSTKGPIRAFSLVFVALGLVLLAVTLVSGGGPLSVGTLLGVDLRRGRRRPALDLRSGRVVSAERADRTGRRRPEPELPPRKLSDAARERLQRGLGVPGLFVAVYSSVGFSIYFALGVVADRGLGLTPLIFLAAGLLFVLTTLSYVEGGAMIRERGGSSSFARHAFNELIAFIAGWAILIDYLIVAALAAISVPHYLEPVSGELLRAGLGDRHRHRW